MSTATTLAFLDDAVPLPFAAFAAFAAEPVAVPVARPVASAETERLYAGDWTAFLLWCEAEGQVALPASAETLAAYVAAASATLGYGALARRCAAIAAAHRRRGLPPPDLLPESSALLRDRRKLPPRRKAAVPSAALVAMAQRCGGDHRGQRDRAILLLLAAGFARRTVVALDAEHIQWTLAGMEVTLPSSSAGAPHIFAISRSADGPTCVVRVLEDWMRASDARFGPLFRKIDRWGTIEYHRLGADAVRRILIARAIRARRSPARRTGRAGRAGVVPAAS